MGIAVITPLYNGARWIESTLRSVLAQSLPAAEVVVVDDGSSDGSTAILQTYSGVTLIKKNPSKGSNTARSFGLSQTSSPVIAFLDQDDIWHPDHLRRLSAALMRDVSAPA